MTLRQALFRTGIGIGIILLALVYMAFVVPSDGLLDIRESTLTVAAIAVGIILPAHAWLAYLVEVLRKRHHARQNRKTRR